MVHLFKSIVRQRNAAWLKRVAFYLAATLLLVLPQANLASAETRTLKLHFVHTGEKSEVTFKKNGKYIDAGLKQANRILRDFRRNEPTKMDRKLLDLVWEVYQQTGSTAYVNVISGYRSPSTNGMLRSRGRGVAKNSQHMLGKAMDFFLTDVKLSKLREVGLKMGIGGVGFYPTSGSPFVHLDTGNVRHWPKMSRQELARIFPDGKTLHVPSDGKPMPRYEQALAEYKSKGRTSNVTVASASPTKKRGFFEMFGTATQEDQADDEAGNAPETAVAPEPVVASATPAEVPATQTLTAGVAAPAPPPAKAGLVPVPAAEIGTAQSDPNSIPLPKSAPRDLLAKPDEPVVVAALEEEVTEDEIPLDRIPLPDRRPDLTVAALPDQKPEEKPEEKITTVAALTADEIENMRRTAVPNEPQIAAIAPSTRVAPTRQSTELAMLEVNSPQETRSIAAVEQLASGTKPQKPEIEPGVRSQVERGPSRQTLELALAATGDSSSEASQAIRDLIEAGGRSISTQQVEVAKTDTGIPVPVRNPRRNSPAIIASTAPIADDSAAKPAAPSEKIGRYALSGGNSIGSLGEIHAPGYKLGATTGETLASAFGATPDPVIVGRFDPAASGRQPALVVRTN